MSKPYAGCTLRMALAEGGHLYHPLSGLWHHLLMTHCVLSGHSVTVSLLDHQTFITDNTGQQRGTTGVREGRARSRTTPGHVARRLLLSSARTR